ncbi:uncharacterized protein B0H64DRAFT_122867 [Chaetomium fimeti]|uniref:Uncharacterized protein n=1 Tax=Chaetomium fimeti TaxID=1854472 RepID=A0AAE0HIR1_9PEZI|nr:hypothetical protein B0H64DRAFT_122867 [Chaetomium fimeti]
MRDNRTHPLLQQLPLTVSPFVNLPTATTLPYRYKPMPSTLPPSTTGITATTTASTTNPEDSAPGGSNNNNTTDPTSARPTSSNHRQQKPRYVVSASGHAAHPDEILASCRALHAHVAQMCAAAEADVARVDARIRAEELAEKRRVAPGWLDSEARLLEPERPAGSTGAAASGGEGGGLMEAGDGLLQGGGYVWGGRGQGEMLLQQPVRGVGEAYGAGNGSGVNGPPGSGYGDGHGHGRGGASEMAVPDEGEELDRAFGKLEMGQ